MKNQKLRVAIVGCGAICENHIQGVLSANGELVALCDVNPARAEAKIEKLGLQNTKVYSDFSTLLDAEKPDVVHICTPHYLHASMVVKALGKGIHVLCEKPLCISFSELDDILAAEAESSATLGVCLQNRYEPMMLRAKELVGDGKNVKAAFGNVVWKRDAEYYRSGEWRGKWKTEGGGVMINQALHTLDLLQWICGMPEKVAAHTADDRLQGVIEVEDTASALFTSSQGAGIHFFATTAADDSFPVQINLKLKDGRIITAQNDWLMVSGGECETASRENLSAKREWGVGHKDLIADFYRHLREGKKFPIDGAEGGKVVKMILSMYASKGEWVKL